MFISKIKLKNFKGFAGEHELTFSEGINFFIGNNNCGKTTVFRAIEFLLSGKNKEDYITKGKEDEEVSVEIELTGTDLETYINSSINKYQNYIINNEDGSASIKIMRSSEETFINQNAKSGEKLLDIRNIRIYKPNSNDNNHENNINNYENPTGVDKTITALFDPIFVFSDIDNKEYQDFSKTKILGKIINEITTPFQQEKDSAGNLTPWGKLKQAHFEAFGEQGISGELQNFSKKLTNVLGGLYEECEITFDFDLPNMDYFIKNGNLTVLENDGEYIPISDKGTGMQRALSLSLIQIYAEMCNTSSNKLDKPIIFFFDEPETFLHPLAQQRLIESINKLSEKSQVFITTHSPYFLKFYDKQKHKLKIFYKDQGYSKFEDKNYSSLFNRDNLSWGEINYYAFNIPSVEFHNELYGYLHSIVQKENTDKKEQIYAISKFDHWLHENLCFEKNKDYVKINKSNKSKDENQSKLTLPTFIRHIIHHPENKNNTYSTKELKRSIDMLVQAIKQKQNQN